MSELSWKDLESIRTLKALYAQRADAVFGQPSRASAEALADLFTEDGILDLGPFGRYQGKAALLHAFESILPGGTQWSVHYMVNPMIEEEGDHAKGRWSFLIFAQAKTPPGAAPGPAAPIWGGYQDRYRKVGETWKIVESVAFYTAPMG